MACPKSLQVERKVCISTCLYHFCILHVHDMHLLHFLFVVLCFLCGMQVVFMYIYYDYTHFCARVCRNITIHACILIFVYSCECTRSCSWWLVLGVAWYASLRMVRDGWCVCVWCVLRCVDVMCGGCDVLECENNVKRSVLLRKLALHSCYCVWQYFVCVKIKQEI